MSLDIPVASFAALAGGRGDVPDDVVISGDHQLGQRVLESMGILPCRPARRRHLCPRGGLAGQPVPWYRLVDRPVGEPGSVGNRVHFGEYSSALEVLGEERG